MSLTITQLASSELLRQSLFAGEPGVMHLDLLKDSCSEGWLHIRLRAGKHDGVPIARTEGVTLYVPSEQFSLISGLKLNYYGDLSGGGFIISTPEAAEGCGCGAGFKFKDQS